MIINNNKDIKGTKFKTGCFFYALFIILIALTACGGGGGGGGGEKPGPSATQNEDIPDRRTENSITYQNDDGTLTTEVSATPINYFENSEWNSLDTNFSSDLENSDYKIGVEKAPIKLLLKDDGVVPYVMTFGTEKTSITWNPQSLSILDSNENVIHTEQGRPANYTNEGNKTTYHEVFNSVDEEFIHLGYMIKHNVVLKTKPATVENGNLFSYSGVMQIPQEQKIMANDEHLLPGGQAEATGFKIKDINDSKWLAFEAPVIFEKEGDTEIAGKYKLTRNKETLTVSIVFDYNWLLKSNRSYPIVIDPTVTIKSDTSNLTGYVYNHLYKQWTNSGGMKVGGRDGDPNYYRGYAEWDINSISNATSINSAQIRFRSIDFYDTNGDGSMSTRFYHMSNRPSTSGGSTVYSDAGDGSCYGYIQWFGTDETRSLSLESTARSHISNNLSEGWFGVGMNIWDSYDPDDRVYLHSNYTSSSYAPKLIVTYTEPSLYDSWQFIDENYYDGTEVEVGTSFRKMWILRNNGTTTWSSYQLCFYSGNQMGASPCVSVPYTSPGSNANIYVDMTAPTALGTHTGYWKIKNSSGSFWGSSVWVQIESISSGDSYEPNDDYSSAAYISNNSTKSNLSIKPAGDNDWFYFSISNSSKVTIEINGSSGDTVLHLYDSSINQISEDDDSGPGLFSKIIRGLGSGTYYIKIRPYSASGQVNNYSLQLTVEQDNMSYVSDITIPDYTQIMAGSSFTKTWRVRNSGQSTWENYSLHFDGENQMGAPNSVSVATTTAGNTRDISVSMTAPAATGTYKGYWKMKNVDGISFGDRIYVIINVIQPTYGATFISENWPDEVSGLDGYDMPPNNNFTKQWTIKNTGNTTWNNSYCLKYVSDNVADGYLSTSQSNVCVSGSVPPNSSYPFSVSMRTPASGMLLREDWKLTNPSGQTIQVSGSNTVWALIDIPDPCQLDGATLTVTSPNGGETWYKGQTYTIYWNATGIGSDTIHIQPYKGGTPLANIEHSATNDGSYPWTIPDGYATGSDYKIGISNTGSNGECDGLKSDFSNSNFSIAHPIGTINVTSNISQASWTITGPETYNGSGTSTTYSNAPTGSYLITWNNIDGYQKPSNETKTLNPGSSISFNGNYISISAPDISFSGQSSINITLPSNQTSQSGSFTISNDGSVNLNYQFDPPTSWLSIRKNGGAMVGYNSVQTLAANNSDYYNLTFNPNGLPAGQYNTGLRILSNDPDESELTIIVTMNVTTPAYGGGGGGSPPPPEEVVQLAQILGLGVCYDGDSWIACAADPVNTLTGNYSHNHVDLKISGIGLNFIFERNYNSQDDYAGPLGLGWTHSYNIILDENPDGDVYIKFGDGHIDFYSIDGMEYQPPKGVFDSLIKDQDNNFILTTVSQIVYRFNLNGQLESITDRNGSAVSLHYDNLYRLDYITDSRSGTIDLQYSSDADFKISAIEDYAYPSRRIEFAYSGDLLRFVTDARGKSTEYQYNADNLLEKMIDPTGNNVIVNTYVEGKVTEQRDGRNKLTTFSYNNPEENHTTVTDPNNNTTVYIYDAELHLVGEKDKRGFTKLYGYNGQNQRTSEIDKKGNETIYEYDGPNLIHERQSVRLNPQEELVSVDTYLTYTPLNDIEAITDPSNHVVHYEYTNGNLSRMWETVEGETVETLYTYYSDGRIETETLPEGLVVRHVYDDVSRAKTVIKETTSAGDENPVTIYACDELWRLTSITDPENRINTITYDENDNILSKSNHLAETTTYTYYDDNSKHTETNPEGLTTRFAYNQNGKLTDVYQSSGGGAEIHVNSIAYDDLDRKISETDADGVTSYYEYDPEGNLTYIKNDSGTPVQINGYDENGNRIWTKNAEGAPTVDYVYDELNRVVQVSDQLGNTAKKSYYIDGDLHSETDAKQDVTNYFYDDKGRLTRRELAGDNGNEVYAYDKEDHRILFTNPELVSTNWNYNELGLLDTEIDSLDQRSFVYNKAGELATKKVNGTEVASYAYDGAGRPKSTVFGDETVVYGYNENGSINSMTDSLGSSTINYTNRGFIESYIDPFQNTVIYTYYPSGRLDTIAYPGNKVVDYDYDNNGRLWKVKDWLDGVTEYSYTSDGRIDTITYPNGIVSSFIYDDALRITEIATKIDESTYLSRYQYTLDELGRVQNATVTEPILPKFYNLNQTYNTNSENQLVSLGGDNFTYDDRGNLTDIEGKGHGFTFDELNRLTGFASGGGVNLSYSYDGSGRRLAKQAGSNTTRYLYDVAHSPSRILAELDENNNVKNYYIYGLGLVAKISSDDIPHYYHFSPQGNTIALTNSNKDVVQSYAYHPFGYIMNREGNIANPFTFAGRFGVVDDKTGYYYMRARYYDPKTGKFLSKDPAGYLDDINLYAYVGNNPISFVDPLGLGREVVNSTGQLFLDYDPLRWDAIVKGTMQFNQAAMSAYVCGLEAFLSGGAFAIGQPQLSAILFGGAIGNLDDAFSNLDNSMHNISNGIHRKPPEDIVDQGPIRDLLESVVGDTMLLDMNQIAADLMTANIKDVSKYESQMKFAYNLHQNVHPIGGGGATLKFMLKKTGIIGVKLFNKYRKAYKRYQNY